MIFINGKIKRPRTCEILHRHAVFAYMRPTGVEPAAFRVGV